jgi:hypothetical protein
MRIDVLVPRPNLGAKPKNTTVDTFQQELIRELDAMDVNYSLFVRRLEEQVFDKYFDEEMRTLKMPEKYYVILLILRHKSPLTVEEIKGLSELFESDEDVVARLKELRTRDYVGGPHDGKWEMTKAGRRFINRRFNKILDERLAELLPDYNLPARQARNKHPSTSEK